MSALRLIATRRLFTTSAIALLSALFILASSVAAQQQQQLSVQVAGLTAVDASNAQAVVSVLDSSSRPRADLTSQEFQAWVNDTSVPVRSVSRAVDSTQPIAIALAIDTSGSMAEGGALEQAKVAARSFVEGLAPQDTVAIVTFADTANTVLPFTQDRAAVEFAIASLTPGGTTALYQATSISLSLAATSATSRRAVVLLSDGGLGVLVDEDGTAKGDALASAETLGVPVFAIGLGAGIDRDYLTQLGQLSGGKFAETPSPAGLSQLYQDVGELLRGQYILALDASASGVPAGEIASLRVDVQAADAVGSGVRDVCLQAVCVALSNLTDGERIKDTRDVEAKIVSAEPVTSVAFVIDGERVETASAPPYRFTIDPASFEKGSHTLVAEVTTASGVTQTREVSLQTGAAAAGSTNMMLLALPVVAVAFLLLVFLALRVARNRSRGKSDPALLGALVKPPPGAVLDIMPQKEPVLVDAVEPMPAPAPVVEALGHLIITAGPLAGQTFSVGSQPMSVGSGSRCQIQLPEEVLDNPDVKPEHARIWIRDGHLMVHELRRLTALGPVGGGWEILSPGDDFVIGSCTFKFQLSDEAWETVTTPSLPEAQPAPSPVVAPAPEKIPITFTPLSMPETPMNATPTTLGALALSPDVKAPTPEPRAQEVESNPAPPQDTEVEVPVFEPIPFRPKSTELSEPEEAVPNVLRDHADEDAVPNVLRDHAKEPQGGPFAELSTTEDDEAVPNVLRERPDVPPAQEDEAAEDPTPPL